MDEKPDQIIGHIEAQRSELGRNLNELESRVRATTNWRTYFERNPGLAVGAALGGGILLGVMVNAKRHGSSSQRSSSSLRRSSSSAGSSAANYAGASAAGSAAMGLSSSASSSSSKRRSSSMVSSPVTSQQMRQISETLDHVKAALIGFGISKAKEFLSHAIPGLDSHLSEAEQRGRQHSSGPAWQPSSPGSATERPTGGTHSWQSAGAQHHEPSPVTF